MAAALLQGAAATAQIHPTHKAEGVAKPVAGDADSIATYRAMLENAPQTFALKGVPRFAVFGKEGKFYFGIGGFVKLTAGYDAGNPVDNPNCFTTSEIPLHVNPGDKGKFNISAMQSHIYLDFVGLPGRADQIGAFIGFNLLDNYTPNLQFAYLKYRGFEAGYDFTLFADPAAGPPTIDFEGPCSASTVQTTQLNYSHEFGKNREWEAGIGIEDPMVSYTTGAGTSRINQRAPAVPAFIRYSWGDRSSWIRLSAIVRNMYYRNEAAESNVDKVGWGLHLSGSARLCPNLTAYYQGIYGKGIGSLMQDINGGGLDMTPGGNGVLNTVKAWGAFGCLQYNFTPDIFMSATYSHVRTYAGRYAAAGAETAWGDQYRYAQYVAGNIFWEINRYMQVGAEYLYGRRVDYSGSQAHDSRIQAMVQFNF